MKNFWPGKKRFAFTIFDDTDVSTLPNIAPVYEFLNNIGLKTTKSVWPLSSEDNKSDYFGSQSLEDAEYCEYVKSLQERGFEIAYHGARMESSDRNLVKKSLEKYKKVLGHYPFAYASHARNRENLYWGENRFSFTPFKLLFLLINGSKRDYFKGHVPGSQFFWGDLSKKYIRFTRTFTFNEINLFKINSRICYTDKTKPYLNYLFISSDADNVEEFNSLINIKNQEKLEKEGGVCILSTHFGKGFVKNDTLKPKTRYLLECLSRRKGWFPTVSELLDYLVNPPLFSEIKFSERFSLEFKWFLHSIKRKLNLRSYEKSELAYLFPNEKITPKI